MAREREVKVTILGDDRGGSKALKGLGDQAGAAETKMSKFGGALGKVGVAAGGLFAGVQLAQFAGDMQSLGVELETMGKKAATVFEGSTGTVTAWAKANASAMGITDDKLRSLAASFGDLLKPMGFTSEQAAKMSTDVVGLSGALSAWSGGTRSAAEVSQILAKAMLGERDSLKELGISITEADVQQRLLEKGQKDLTGTALEQAKAIATQELIFEKSADAQKAWADGSMDAVKKQNALKQKIGELREDLATKLMPVFAAVVEFILYKVIPALEQMVAWVQRNWPEMKRVIIETWNSIKSEVMGALEMIKGTIQVMMGVITGDWRRAWEGVKDILSGIWHAIEDTARAAVATIVDHFLGMVGVIVGAAARAFGWLPVIGDDIQRAARAFEEFRDRTNAALRGIEDRTVYVTVVTQGGDQRTYGGEIGGRTSPGIQMHTGGIVPGSGNVPTILQGGEGVFTPEQMAVLGASMGRGGDGASAGVMVHITVGTLVGSDGIRELTDMIQTTLLQKQRRVATLGLT